MAFIERLKFKVRGVRVAIVGPSQAGKTTMQTWLRESVIVKDPPRTQESVRVPRGRATFESGGRIEKITFTAGSDVRGDAIKGQNAWRKVINRSDVLVYLFDA